jgi:Protein of unknown function (DUF2793)
MTTSILGLQEIAEGVASQAALHNQALRELEARSTRVKSRTTTAPPGSPVEGDSYIVPSGATGVWSGKTNQIAAWIGGAWNYFVPIEGVGGIWVNDTDVSVTFDGGAWVVSGGSSVGTVTSVALTTPAEFSVAGSPVTASGTLAISKANQSANLVWAGPSSGGAAAPTFRALVAADMPVQPYDIAFGFSGKPSVANNGSWFAVVPRIISLPAALSGSYVKAKVAATAQTDFDVKKNGTSIGTIRFAAAASSATFISFSAATTAAGDTLEIVPPTTADATLDTVSGVLVGTR